ncbi:DNA topoisomerase 3 [Bacillus subtilis]|uniref:DNA topoisomerase 3 n=1 Tax=Bacillus subtilis TaxID=1423 RepID=UPI002DBFA662|nr:DNA topoisomerase 3 [Bacillus subtilis]MEC0434431.1 DNA topoisomerase 3 [Bacillus subtilis]
MSTVILAEKPSQAKDYAAAFKKTTKKSGYIEVEDSQFFSGKAFITWGFGHLVELAEPKAYKEEWAKWDLKELPIFPEKFKFQVSEDTKKQFNIVKKLLKESSEIIIATDPDREGENIARSIIALAGATNKPTKRLWANSLLPEPLRKAFADLKDGKNYVNMYVEAQTRQISDWLIGMNLSRLYTLLLQGQGVHEAFSIGRVQTPTLYLIYQREQEIENFVSKPFFELFANLETENGLLTVKNKKKLDTPQQVKELLAKHKISAENQAIISEVKKEKKSTAAPKLFSLSKLQSKANKQWKYSPQQVLETVQSLYDKKILSYPRTDTEFIGEGEFEYLKENLVHYQKSVGCTFDLAYSEPRKKYVDGSKVQEHYAIIPTQKIPTESEINELSEIQRTIYFEVVRNTIAMFAPDYEYEETQITVNINDLLFHASGKVERKKGWKELFSNDRQEDDKEEKNKLPAVNEGASYTAKMDIRQGKTKPPKPYTEGQLINMMITAGKAVDDDDDKEILKETEGIGTEATRASIIETLKKQNYISVNNNKVEVTAKGKVLCRTVENTILASPSMTADWEKHLKKLGNGQGTQANFLKNIQRLIDKLLNDAPVKVQNKELNSYIDSVKDQFKEKKKPKSKKKFKTRKKVSK